MRNTEDLDALCARLWPGVAPREPQPAPGAYPIDPYEGHERAAHPQDKHDEDPGPCVGCPHQERCAGGQACEQFRIFVSAGNSPRWRIAPRQPSVAIFRELFEEG